MHVLLRASCLKLEIKEICCYEAKIEESEKGRQIVRVGGCQVAVAQWQNTGGSGQGCPAFDSWRLLALLYFCLITSNFLVLFTPLT